MLSRGLTSALRLRSRALSASVPSNRPLNACSEAQSVPQGLSLLQSKTFTSSGVCGIFAAGGSLQQEGSSSQASSSKKAQNIAATPPKLAFLHDARSIAAEQALVTRLANIWGMPPEVLASNVAMLSDLLKPCGRDTAAHALWVLVRCPALRHMTDQQVRHTVRGLHQRFPDIPKSAFKATVYKHPWVLHAQLPSPHTATAAKDAGSFAPEQQQQKVLVTPWKQELALMLLEMQTPSSDSSSDCPAPDSSNSVSVGKPSSAAALAGVKVYLAAAEAQHILNRGVAWAKGITTSRAPAATGSPVTAMKPGGSPSAAAGPIKPTPPSSTAADAADSLDCFTAPLQQPCTPRQVNRSREEQQQLQQLLYQCPRLTVLPPDLLASRWQLLLSVLLGQVESATAVARTNPYLMVTGYGYTDKPQQGGSGGLSDWDYSQLAGLV